MPKGCFQDRYFWKAYDSTMMAISFLLILSQKIFQKIHFIKYYYYYISIYYITLYY